MVNIAIFGPLREVVGNNLQVEVPEEGMLFSDIIKTIDGCYSIEFKEYVEMPLMVVLVNGMKIKSDYDRLIKIGDEILITVMISGG